MKRVALTASAVVLLCSAASAAEWGTISGKIELIGKAPERELQHPKGAAVTNPEVCAAEDTYKQDMIVDEKTNGVANVFIYLYSAPDDVHPDEAKVPEAKLYLDQEKCVFKPHAMVIRAGQTVEVLNSDNVTHNTRITSFKNQGENVTSAANTKKGEGFEWPTSRKERVPITVACDFHKYMTARWLIIDHPYAAVTDAKGNFKIKNLPVGEHKFRIWHERPGYLSREHSITVKAGDNKLDPIKYELKKFETDE